MQNRVPVSCVLIKSQQRGGWLAVPCVSTVYARENGVWVWLAAIRRRASDSLRTYKLRIGS